MKAPGTQSEGFTVTLVVDGVQGFDLIRGGAPPTTDRTKVLIQEVDLPLVASNERS